MKRHVFSSSCNFILQVVIAFCSLVSTSIFAASLNINPVKLHLNQQQPIQMIVVRNEGDHSTVIQVDAVKWSQLKQEEIYLPTTDLLVTPPIFTIAAGSAQVVRVGLRVPTRDHEQTYRLFLQEVPQTSDSINSGLQLALRISMPVFVLADTSSKAELKWSLVAVNEQMLKLVVTNSGHTHEHLSAFALFRQNDAEPIVTQSLFQYLLQDTRHEWLLPVTTMPKVGERITIKAKTEQGEIDTEIVVTE